jgi:hypothetical protein
MRGVAPRLHGLPLEHRLSLQCSPLRCTKATMANQPPDDRFRPAKAIFLDGIPEWQEKD